MQDFWPQLILTGGVSLLLLVAIGIGLWRGAWPYAKKLIDGMLARMDKLIERHEVERTRLQEEHKIERERLDREHRAEREKMLNALNQLSAGYMNTTNAVNASTAALQELTDAVEQRNPTPRARQERPR